MKNKLLLTLLSIFIHVSTNAQSTPLWTQTMNSLPDSSFLYPERTEVDIFGNVVTLCVQSATSGLDQKIYLRKFDTNGSIIWTQIFDNSGSGNPRGYDLAVDSSANIYVAGGLMTNDEPLLMKFNSAGNVVWQRDSTTAFSFGAFHQMVMKNRLLYLNSSSGIAVFDFFGNEQWSVGIAPNFIAVDNAGRVVASLFAGATNLMRFKTDGSLDFSAVTIDASHIAIDYLNNIYLINNYGAYDLVRFDSSGVFSWVKEDIAICPPFGDISVELVVDWDQDVIAIGLNDSMYKYNYDGDFVWQRSMNGLDNYRISTSLFSQNYILIAGTLQGPTDNNVRVATFDVMGSQNWFGDYNSNSIQEFSRDMAFDDSGIYLLEDSMSSSSLIKFDYPFTAGQAIDYSLLCVDSIWYDTLNPVYINIRLFNGNFAHLNYPSIQMVSPLGDTISNRYNLVNFFAHIGNTLLTYQDTITEFGIQDFSDYHFFMSEGFGDTTVEISLCLTNGMAGPNSTHFSVYPNPATGNVQIIDLPLGEKYVIQVFDAHGKICYTSKLEDSNSVVDLNNLSSGLYILKLSGKSGVRYGKVIKQ
ncbi:MAG: T9SS type A sorting domain-containing protein [Bacteroidia bacterium]|nr:T9SS type A sorting domain-containing protein [Bacteroidia bacterium]